MLTVGQAFPPVSRARPRGDIPNGRASPQPAWHRHKRPTRYAQRDLPRWMENCNRPGDSAKALATRRRHGPIRERRGFSDLARRSSAPDSAGGPLCATVLPSVAIRHCASEQFVTHSINPDRQCTSGRRSTPVASFRRSTWSRCRNGRSAPATVGRLGPDRGSHADRRSRS